MRVLKNALSVHNSFVISNHHMPCKDPHKRRAWQKKYDDNRKESRRVYQKVYDKQRNALGQPRAIKRSQEKQKKRDYDRQWYQENKQIVLLQQQQYYNDNQEMIRRRHQDYYHDKHNPLVASLLKPTVNWFGRE
tara:strand:- start:261 stop:662 length:402 start_codon:yes stop_codon:yes gene_type:complete